MYYVYVLRSKKRQTLYGPTGDLKRRVAEHNQGYEPSIKNMVPLELVYYEACPSKYDALRREKYLKTVYCKRYLKNRVKELTGAIPRGSALLNKTGNNTELICVNDQILIGNSWLLSYSTCQRKNDKPHYGLKKHAAALAREM
jgi:putative endonuclease